MIITSGNDSKKIGYLIYALLVIVFASIFETIAKRKRQLKRINMFNNPLIPNEGKDRSFFDIISLLDLIKKYESIYLFPIFPKIKLTGIKTKEELNINKKYSVELTTWNKGFITEIEIREQ